MNTTVWTAVDYLKRGLSVLPLAIGGKRPIGSWEAFQQVPATVAQATEWHAHNIGVVTGAVSGIVVVDCESIDNANWFLSHRAAGLRPGVVATPRGIHFYFQHPGGRVMNATHVCDGDGVSRYDVRGDGGYVVAPPSKVDRSSPDVSVSGEYRWIREFDAPSELPLFRPAWRPEPAPATTGAARRAPHAERRVRDGAAYIQHIHAVAGERGHDNTFRAVCRLRDSGLDELEAYAVISEWNDTNAHPPWSSRELLHKVKSVFAKGR